jgi:hypothetical protein
MDTSVVEKVKGDPFFINPPHKEINMVKIVYSTTVIL